MISMQANSWNMNDKLHGQLIQLLFDAQTDLAARVEQYRKVDAILKPIHIKKPNGAMVIELPTIFPMFDTARTSLSELLISDPLLKYEGTSPEDAVGAALLEKVVQSQCRNSGAALAVDSMISNCLKYNTCAGVVTWKQTRDVRGNVISEGSVLSVIDPYKTFYDGALPPHRFQDANFIGWYDTIPIAKLMELVKSGYFQKFEEMKSVIDAPSAYLFGGLDSLRRYPLTPNARVVDVVTLYANIIPYEFGLGDSLLPEKWLFCILGNNTIIKAQPLGMEHNLFPLVVISPDFDDFDNTALSRTGMLTGLQELINWMFSTHIQNTTRATGNRMVIDPTAVNINDVIDNHTYIRVRKRAVGRDVRTMVQQLEIKDTTANYYGDIAKTMEVMQSVSGADSASSGQLRKDGPERLTSKEYIGTLSAAQGRLGRIAKVLAQQLFPNLGRFFAYNTQKVMSRPTQVKFAGRWEELLSKQYNSSSALASMSDLNVNYDVIVHEGSKTNESSAELWIEVFKLVSTSGVLVQQFDIIKIFDKLMQSMGVKDVEALHVKQEAMTQDPNADTEQPGIDAASDGGETTRFMNIADMLSGGA